MPMPFLPRSSNKAKREYIERVNRRVRRPPEEGGRSPELWRGARRRRGADHRVAVGGHALPIHDVVLLLQRFLGKRCATRAADDSEGASRRRANGGPFAGVACGCADPGTKPRAERGTQ